MSFRLDLVFAMNDYALLSSDLWTQWKKEKYPQCKEIAEKMIQILNETKLPDITTERQKELDEIKEKLTKPEQYDYDFMLAVSNTISDFVELKGTCCQ